MMLTMLVIKETHQPQQLRLALGNSVNCFQRARDGRWIYDASQWHYSKSAGSKKIDQPDQIGRLLENRTELGVSG